MQPSCRRECSPVLVHRTIPRPLGQRVHAVFALDKLDICRLRNDFHPAQLFSRQGFLATQFIDCVVDERQDGSLPERDILVSTLLYVKIKSARVADSRNTGKANHCHRTWTYENGFSSYPIPETVSLVVWSSQLVKATAMLSALSLRLRVDCGPTVL
jgi:hypothetical protein